MTDIQPTDAVVRTRDLRKSFHLQKETVEAVCGVDLAIERGAIYGVLGPNGAGKTTTLRMLATLLPIDGGEATVAGIDVRRQPREVRRRIGYVGQLGGTDQSATGRENLVLQGQLYGASTADAHRRAGELIGLLELGSFADRIASTYSGGQKRRLEVALGIMHRPEVLFLDEPTTGLDPQNRANLWDQLRSLRAAGTTIVLTTHYLEEADALADRLAIVDHGRVVAEGTPPELKRALAGDAITVRPKPDGRPLVEIAATFAGEPFVRETRVEGPALHLYVTDGAAALPLIVDRLRAGAIGLESITLAAPSLDDVFLRCTGRSLRDAGNGHTETAKADHAEVAA